MEREVLSGFLEAAGAAVWSDTSLTLQPRIWQQSKPLLSCLITVYIIIVPPTRKRRNDIRRTWSCPPVHSYCPTAGRDKKKPSIQELLAVNARGQEGYPALTHHREEATATCWLCTQNVHLACSAQGGPIMSLWRPEGRQLPLGGNCRSFRRRSWPSLWASRSITAIHIRHTDGPCPGGKPALCFLSHHGKNDIFFCLGQGGEEKQKLSFQALGERHYFKYNTCYA